MDLDTKIIILYALRVGLDSAQSEANEFHNANRGFRQYRHDEMDENIKRIKSAIRIVSIL
jgi:hypothetical protein